MTELQPDPSSNRRNQDISGPVLFARYAYPPNALGYCGQSDPDELYEALVGVPDIATLKGLARSFEGAWPYLQMIAACNHIADPLDSHVVKAYWVGNSLLKRVDARFLGNCMEDRFTFQAGRNVQSIVELSLLGGLAHHSFHVFAVYPWVQMLRRGDYGGPALRVLDQCRIRWGEVQECDASHVVVLSAPLEFEGSQLFLSTPRYEKVRRTHDAKGSPIDLRPGDKVSLHWDWVCDRLTLGGWRNLVAVNRHNIALVNAQAIPGHAVAADRTGG